MLIGWPVWPRHLRSLVPFLAWLVMVDGPEWYYGEVVTLLTTLHVTTSSLAGCSYFLG